ncbi:hypothetical protein C8F04DRAFT_1199472 [Mycena alexandri]|uniref:Uncharacterized protein n=1 Tax=Mycena alexandri TaxID=1745969 RepID=A0AAD6WNQ2_9AGAR|nr:hypothetical protein C8F04DRAFT_1199472 [Mycena alexandri]
MPSGRGRYTTSPNIATALPLILVPSTPGHPHRLGPRQDGSGSTSATPLVLKPTTTTAADFHSTLVPLLQRRLCAQGTPFSSFREDFQAQISARTPASTFASTFVSRNPHEIRVHEQYKRLGDDQTQPYLNLRLPEPQSPCRSAQDYERPTKNDSTHLYDSALYFATPPCTTGRKTDGNIVSKLKPVVKQCLDNPIFFVRFDLKGAYFEGTPILFLQQLQSATASTLAVPAARLKLKYPQFTWNNRQGTPTQAHRCQKYSRSTGCYKAHSNLLVLREKARARAARRRQEVKGTQSEEALKASARLDHARFRERNQAELAHRQRTRRAQAYVEKHGWDAWVDHNDRLTFHAQKRTAAAQKQLDDDLAEAEEEAEWAARRLEQAQGASGLSCSAVDAGGDDDD